MGSENSKSAKITHNGNEGLKGLLKEMEGIIAITKGVFLSHSDEQKNLIRQLRRDLEDLRLPCIFDEDCESLPVGGDFRSRKLEAAETCSLAVLLLSKEVLETKRAMLELSAFVNAKANKNPNLVILPLFYKIPPNALKQYTADNKKWKKIEKSEKMRAEWQRALQVIRRINGLKFSKGDDEVKFRDKIVEEIWCKLPTHPQRYHVPRIQGEERMGQMLADFVYNVHPNENGIHIAGLYGKAGHGKTTLGKGLCNVKCRDFAGKVCHLEFSGADPFQRIKDALTYLTAYRISYLHRLTKDQAQIQFYERVKGQRVLLVLDNITEESIGELRYYLGAELGKNSCILLSARSMDVLLKHFKIDSQSCMCVPSLEEDEAIHILLERTPLKESTLEAEDRGFAREIVRKARTFRPLALKAFGRHLFRKYGPNLSKWVSEMDGSVDGCSYGLDEVFALLGKDFDAMPSTYRSIFMLLTVYRPPNMVLDKETKWLAMNCNEEIDDIEKAVEYLCNMGFIEKHKRGIRIHPIYVAFAHSKAKEMKRWLWWKGDPRSPRGLIPGNDSTFELAKLEKTSCRSPSQIAKRYLTKLWALQLVGMRNMIKLDLGRMGNLRSIILHNCENLVALDGMENLLCLAWLQIGGVNSMFKLPDLSCLTGLQHLEIVIPDSQVCIQLGDLTSCFNLKDIIVHCPSLLEFPRLNGLPFLGKVEFLLCDKLKGILDCTKCGELQSIVLDSRCQVACTLRVPGSKVVVSWREVNQ